VARHMAFSVHLVWVVRYSSFELNLLKDVAAEALENFRGSPDMSTSAKVSVPSSILKMAKTTVPMALVDGANNL